MPNPLDKGDPRRLDAQALYFAWVQERQAGRGPDFDRFRGEHPRLAEELIQLHSVFELCQTLAASRSFQQALREQFGEDAEFTVQLDEASPPPTGSAAGEPEHGVRHVGRYTLEDEFAHGGMGAIWRVRDRDLSRTLAMKVMSRPAASARSNEGSSKLGLARFLEEAQITAQLDHPGIVPVHEAGCDAQGQPYFIMKLVKGRDLNDIFKLVRDQREGWNLSRAVGVIVKACQALAYAHAKGVIHRDLKPSNIMVGRFGEVFVMDWGLARITGKKDLHDLRVKLPELTSASLHSKRHEDTSSTPDSPIITMDGSVVGTPAYMAPEQARGQVEEVDAASDIYSMGAILYSLLTGQAPYLEPGARISPHTILGMVIQGPPARIHRLNPVAPGELAAICEKAMARDKMDRYTSSLDLAEDLQAFLDRRVVRAYRTGAVAEFQSWIVRNTMTAVVGGVALLLALAGVAAYVAKERSNSLRLQHNLARQYLHRGYALSESGDVTRGLHWFARAWNEAPLSSEPLRQVIRENLNAWSRELNPPSAILQEEAFVYEAVLSPDGKRIATNPLGKIKLWSSETGERIGDPFPRNAQPLREVPLSFSPDGKMLLTGDGTTIHFWSAETAKPLGPQLVHAEPVTSAAFSPDGKRVLTGMGRAAMLWSLETGEPIGPPLQHDTAVRSVRFGPDGSRALTLSMDATARLWDLPSTGSAPQVLAHDSRVYSAAFSPDGKLILTTTAQAVHFWSAETGQPSGPPIQHGAEMLDTAFSPDGQRIVTAGSDKIARVWSVPSRQLTSTITWHQDVVLAVAFSPDSKTVLTGSKDRTTRLWSVESGEPVGAPILLPAAVREVAFSPEGNHALIHPAGQTLFLYHLSPRKENLLPLENFQRIPAFAFSPDGKRLAGGIWARSRNLSAQMWSTETGKQVGAPMPHKDAVWGIAFSPDGTTVLTGSRDRTARLWSAQTGEPLAVHFEHEAEVRTVAFSPDGSLVATGSFDGTARLWSPKSGKQIGTTLMHPSIVEDVAFSPDGTKVLTACGDGAARLWSVVTSTPLLPPMWHRGGVLAVVFSLDGKRIVTGGRDNIVRIWDAQSGRPHGRNLEHRDQVEDMCVTVDGRRLWTVTPMSARVWDLETGEPLGPHVVLQGQGMDIALSPDESRLAIADGASGHIRILPSAVPSAVLRNPTLWVEALTWTEMDEDGALSWMDDATHQQRQKVLDREAGH